MTTLAWIIIAFVGGIGAAGIISALIVARKNGDPLTQAWIKIRPILSEVFVEAVKVYQANQVGYDALVDYCVKYVKNKVDNADFLLPEEKAILTYEFLYGIIEPQLKKLWEQKMLSQVE